MTLSITKEPLNQQMSVNLLKRFLKNRSSQRKKLLQYHN